jgi:DNA-binding protein H-NS
MDLNTMSLSELRRLQSRVNGEIQRRNDSARRNFLKKVRKMAAEDGLSLSEVIGDITQAETRETQPRKRKAKAAEKKSGKLPVRYHHPERPGIGWSGHGRRPQWVIDWLAEGKPLEALEPPSGN